MQFQKITGAASSSNSMGSWGRWMGGFLVDIQGFGRSDSLEVLQGRWCYRTDSWGMKQDEPKHRIRFDFLELT